jgi:O-antigen ligase
MQQERKQNTLAFFFVFITYLLSNVLTFAFQFWLYPKYLLITTLLWLVFAIIFLWVLRQSDLIATFFETLKRNWFIFPFLIFSGLSILWSILWQISLYRWLIFIATIITGAFIGFRYNLKENIKTLTIFILWILILSIIVIIIMPSIGLHNYSTLIIDAWRGVYWQKNHTGIVAAFGNILCLISFIGAFKVNGKQKYIWGLPYLFTLLFVTQTDSVGAYMSLIFTYGIIGLALIWLKIRNQVRRTHILIFLVLFVAISILVATNVEKIFSIFNRSTSLTGRVPLWSHLFNAYFSKRPLFGYGFNAFWYINSIRMEMSEAVGYEYPIIIADNGFIDMLVNTGIVGFVLFLLFYFGLWWRSIKFAYHAENIIGFFPVILMAYVLIANVSWSLLFENENFFMLIMISVLFCISKGNTVSIMPEKQNAGR